MTAAREGEVDVFELLLEHHATVTKKNSLGWTVIHLAAMYNQKTILDRLLPLGLCCTYWGSTVDIDDNDGHTPLWWAVSEGHVDCVDVLLVHGANPDHKSKSKESPLDVARKCGHTTIVSMMTDVLESAPSRQYAISVFNTVAKSAENIKRCEERICQRDREVHELQKMKERFQGELRLSEQKMKNARSETEIQQTVHICDPEKVFQAVVSHGCNRWYSLCLQMGSSSFEVDSITSGIPNRADKIRAVFNKKIDDIGERAATEALLQACRRIPHPIIGGVMDSLSKRIP